MGFVELLERLDKVDGLARVRYESAHPRFLTDELIAAHASLRTLCEHLHLPVQSGSNGVLAKMGRGHSREEFISWVSQLRDRVSGVGISTDLFVGFPGEGVADFRDTLRLLEEVSFDSVYSFKYSPRPGTPAADLDDDVPMAEKISRLAELQELQETITSHHLEGLVGEEVEVLVEGLSKRGTQLRGRTRRNTIVNIDIDTEGRAKEKGSLEIGSCLKGEMVRVKLDHAGGHSVRGRIISSVTSLLGGAEFAA